MPRRFVLIGPALLALLLATSAHAQQSPLCDQLQDAPALSPYVQQVLERADRGLNYIAESGAGTGDPSLYWRVLVENAGAAVISGMDTSRRITVAMQDLTSRSACLRYDAILLSCKIEQVRTRLNEQLSLAVSPSPNTATVFQLQELLIFLFDRDRHLAAGATDPWYADPDWGRVFAFDPPAPGFCCRTGDDGLSCESLDEAECNPGTFWSTEADCEQACGVTSFPGEDPRVCPYHSDYGYPTEGGYGCDETIMPDAAIVADEKTALTELRAAVERLRQEAGADPAPDRAPALIGCASEFGHCNDNGAQTCRTDSDCDDVACVYQRGTCLNDPSVSCTLDADCTVDDGELAAVCLLPPVSPPAAVIRRGPFNLQPDDLRLTRAFMNWSIRVGASRPFGSAGAEPRDQAGGDQVYVDPIDFILNQNNRSYFRQAAANFATGQARFAPLTETSNALQRMLMPLREAVAELSTLASAKEGIRRFVRRFADLLHHSCATDPCQTDLERIWSMANTDECFAYADGTYLEDDCANGESRAQKCADAAGVAINVPACETP